MPLGPRTQIGITMTMTPPTSVLATDFIALGLDVRSFREPLNRVVREVAIPSIRTNFEVGGRPQWQELEQSTEETRAYQGFATSILWRTGTLVNAATQISDWTITSEEAFISNLPERAWYGELHDQGIGGMPERQFFMFQQEDLDAADTIFETWLMERLTAHGWTTDIGVGTSGGYEVISSDTEASP